MKQEAYKTLTVRLEPMLLDKFRYIAWYEGRSCNGQLRVTIRQCVEAFEQENGPIPSLPRKTHPSD